LDLVVSLVEIILDDAKRVNPNGCVIEVSPCHVQEIPEILSDAENLSV
jgi:hypothetical protein